MSVRNTLIKTVMITTATLLLTACSSLGLGKKDEELAFVEEPAEIIYNNAFAEVERGDWANARRLFQEVERQHPFSKWARRGILMSAYSSYREANYSESVASAQRFIDLNPGNDSTPYAYYLIAINFYDQIFDVGRDQGTTVNAEAALQQVVRRFPESDYARDARLKLELTHDHLAGKEMSVGRFYQKQNQQLAAIGRFKSVVRDYETTSHVEEAMHRLVESYVALGVVGEAKKVGAVLGHNYPNGDWYEDSFKLLDRQGINLNDEVSAPKPPGYWRRLRERLF